MLLEGGAEIAFAGISEPYADFLEADVFVNYQLADPFHSFVGNVFGGRKPLVADKKTGELLVAQITISRNIAYGKRLFEIVGNIFFCKRKALVKVLDAFFLRLFLEAAKSEK